MKKKTAFLLVICVIVSLFVGCSNEHKNEKSYEQMIIGDWYSEYVASNYTTTWQFSFYEDGAYKESPSTKSGTWNIVDHNNTKQIKLTDAWKEFDLYEIVYIDDNTLELRPERGEVKTFKRSKEEYSTYKQIQEYRLKNGDNEKPDEEIKEEIDAINKLCEEADCLTDGLKFLQVSIIAGSINKSTPKDELGNLDITKLPNADASFQERRECGSNLTIKDVIDYYYENENESKRYVILSDISEEDLSKFAWTKERDGGGYTFVYQDYLNSDDYVLDETIYDLKYSTRIQDLK